MTATIQSMKDMGLSEDLCKKARNIASFTNISMRNTDLENTKEEYEFEEEEIEY